MRVAWLECDSYTDAAHARPCVQSLACWWSEVQELELLLDYNRSSLRARQVWDALLACELLTPQPALYVELRACAASWTRMTRGLSFVYPSLLDRFVQTADSESLPLPKYAVLAAFRLRQRLCGVRSSK